MVEIKISQIIEAAAEDLGFSLVRVLYSGGQAGRNQLQIMAEPKEERDMTVEDCQMISRHVSALLDVEDPIVGEYTLEVSSPGTDRLLFSVEQFQQYCGEEVDIRMRSPIEGRRKFKGMLQDVVNRVVQIEVEGSSFKLPIEEIEKANIVY